MRKPKSLISVSVDIDFRLLIDRIAKQFDLTTSETIRLILKNGVDHLLESTPELKALKSNYN